MQLASPARPGPDPARPPPVRSNFGHPIGVLAFAGTTNDIISRDRLKRLITDLVQRLLGIEGGTVAPTWWHAIGRLGDSIQAVCNRVIERDKGMRGKGEKRPEKGSDKVSPFC